MNYFGRTNSKKRVIYTRVREKEGVYDVIQKDSGELLSMSEKETGSESMSVRFFILVRISLSLRISLFANSPPIT